MDQLEPNATPPSGGRQPSTGCLLGVLLVAVLGVWLLLRFGLLPEGVVEGEKLPALELVPLTGQGQPVTLDELEGKVVLVNFWATWCPPCRMELPHMAELRRHFLGNEDFVLLAVSTGNPDLQALPGETRKILGELDVDLPVYMDPNRITQDAYTQVAGWRGFPTTFVLDRTGTIRQEWVGYAPGLETEMEATIEQLLDETDDPPTDPI